MQCQNSYGRYKVGEPEVTLHCAKEAGIDWVNGPAGRCAGAGSDKWAKGEEGVRLLKESVKQTEGLGIEFVSASHIPEYTDFVCRKSCTIVIAGKKVCVRDETWKECEVWRPPQPCNVALLTCCLQGWTQCRRFRETN